MRVAVGCDHAGFPLKADVCAAVEAASHTVVNCGTDSSDPVDYPDNASAVAAAILEGRAQRGSSHLR